MPDFCNQRLAPLLAGLLLTGSLSVGLVALGTSSASASMDCASSGLPSYVVVAGDSWSAIADRVDVTTAALLDVNQAEIDGAIHPGDVVCLPDGTDPGAACGDRRYTVESGDSWNSIALALDVSAATMLSANGAGAGTVIHPGDRLCLPSGATTPNGGESSSSGSSGSYQVESGDSWFAIAQSVGVPVGSLLEVNGAGTDTMLLPGATITLPAGAAPRGGSTPTRADGRGGSYTVRRGDSWSAIADRAGVSMRALLDVNGASRSTTIMPGDDIDLPSGADRAALAQSSSGGAVTLAIPPVQGPCQYADTWQAPRSGGRRHEGVDLFARRGQYVYAVVDGVLTTRHWDQPGKKSGNAWWLHAADGSATFFYAHLSDFAPGLQEGSRVRAGQIIGFVGDTGNAAGVHLHFEVHPGGGKAVNPYPSLSSAGGCNQGDPYRQPGGWTPDRLG